MSRRPAAITQAEIARIIRAAKQTGAAEVEIRIRDTSIIIRLEGRESAQSTTWIDWDVKQIEERPERDTRHVPDKAPSEIEKWQDPEWRDRRFETWKDHVRLSPLGVLERKGLAGLYAQKGQAPARVKGASINTMERLEVRGFASPLEAKPNRTPHYVITPEGEAQWQIIQEAEHQR